MSDVVTREIKIAAPPEEVFPYFIEHDKIVRWKGQAIEHDPRVGGGYRLTVLPGSVAAGEFVAIEPPHRIVYTWGWEGSPDIPPGSSTVELTFEADGDYTLVRLVHRDLPTEEARAQHATGWEHYLARLAIAAAGDDPGRDPWLDGAP